MLSIALRINDKLIGHAIVYNKGLTNISEQNNDLYNYEYSYIDYSAKDILEGKIVHKRSEGALVLTQRVITDIKKKEN